MDVIELLDEQISIMQTVCKQSEPNSDALKRNVDILDKLIARKQAEEAADYQATKDAADRGAKSEALEQERELTITKLNLDCDRFEYEKEKDEKDREERVADREANLLIEREKIESNERIRMQELKSDNLKAGLEFGGKVAGGAVTMGGLVLLLTFEETNNITSKSAVQVIGNLFKLVHL